MLESWRQYIFGLSSLLLNPCTYVMWHLFRFLFMLLVFMLFDSLLLSCDLVMSFLSCDLCFLLVHVSYFCWFIGLLSCYHFCLFIGSCSSRVIVIDFPLSMYLSPHVCHFCLLCIVKCNPLSMSLGFMVQSSCLLKFISLFSSVYFVFVKLQ